MKELLSIIGLYLVMELGDKTMLSSIALAAKYNPWVVFIGALIGLGTVTALAVTVGQVLSQHLSMEVIQKVSGVLFLVVGALILLGKL